MLHSDDVIAGIDVMNLTRDAAREIAEEIHRGVADFLDRHAPPQRRIVLGIGLDLAQRGELRLRRGLLALRGVQGVRGAGAGLVRCSSLGL